MVVDELLVVVWLMAFLDLNVYVDAEVGINGVAVS